MNTPNNVKPINAASPKRRFTREDIKRGKLDVPKRILGFGGEKVGKSTWASGAPGALFVCPENGTPHLDIARLPTPESWDELFDVLALAESDPDCKSLVIDPVNWLEDLVWARVVGGPSAKWDENTRDKIEKHGGGFKKGYEAAVGHWRTLTKVLESRHYEKGQNVILLAHSFKKKFSDPSGVEYDRYEVQMHDKASGLLRQWVDDVLFFRHEVLAKVEGSKTVAIATGANVIHTVWDKAWDAGNRSGLPPELPMSWEAYWSAAQGSAPRVAALKSDIEKILVELADPDLAKNVRAAVAAAKDNAERLTEFLNALRIRKDQEK